MLFVFFHLYKYKYDDCLHHFPDSFPNIFNLKYLIKLHFCNFIHLG